MKMSLKITTRLQCEDSNVTISRLNQRFSSKYAPKITCLKKHNLRKKSAVNQISDL